MRRFALMGAGLLSIAGFAGVASAADLLVKAAGLPDARIVSSPCAARRAPPEIGASR